MPTGKIFTHRILTVTICGDDRKKDNIDYPLLLKMIGNKYINE